MLGFRFWLCLFQVCGCVVVTSNGNCVVSLIEGWDQGLGCHRVEVGFRFGVLSSGFYGLLLWALGSWFWGSWFWGSGCWVLQFGFLGSRFWVLGFEVLVSRF